MGQLLFSHLFMQQFLMFYHVPGTMYGNVEKNKALREGMCVCVHMCVHMHTCDCVGEEAGPLITSYITM